MGSGFWIFNKTGEPVETKISKWTQGSEAWYPIAQGSNDSWRRAGWEIVMFRSQDKSQTVGYYLNSGTKWLQINFLGFDKQPEFIPNVES